MERFAVIDIAEFIKVKEIISSTEKLQDYLDYLHIQEIKQKNEKTFSMDEVRKELGI